MSAGKRAPVVAAWGAGTNSTAMIIELVRRGEIPDMTLLAAMPEQPHTRQLIPVFGQWMDDHGVPNEIVEYQPRFFKHWPPYTSLLDACLTNGTLPSIAFGQHSCSARHKISPQDKWVKAGLRHSMPGPMARRSSGSLVMTARPVTISVTPIAKGISQIFMNTDIHCAIGASRVKIASVS